MRLLLLLLLAGACHHDERRPPSPADVVARVDGTPLTEADVALRLQGESHAAAAAPLGADVRARVLDQLVRQQLLADRAVKLGLDHDAQFQSSLAERRAQLDAWRRKELGELALRREVYDQTAVGEDEVRRFFEANRGKLQTQLHVMQILRRSAAEAEEARRALADGKPFDEVAALGFPPNSVARRPWDLGFLQWQQLPPAWREVAYDLAPNKPSAVLRGPNERFWIIAVVERREGELAFEAVKVTLAQALHNQKAELRREALERELLQKARIDRSIEEVKP